MSAKLSTFPMAQPRSSLLMNYPDQVPLTEELELLHAELKVMKQKTLERAKKASQDLTAIEASFRSRTFNGWYQVVDEMSAKLSTFPMAQPRSSLLKNGPDQVLLTEELELLHAELEMMRQEALERAKKAGQDLTTIEASFRRMEEREKGKAKAVDKMEHERDCMCIFFG